MRQITAGVVGDDEGECVHVAVPPNLGHNQIMLGPVEVHPPVARARLPSGMPAIPVLGRDGVPAPPLNTVIRDLELSLRQYFLLQGPAARALFALLKWLPNMEAHCPSAIFPTTAAR